MITIKEVAKEAGVSITTVSRVMNNRGYISAETRGKVEGAMKKLNYQPNQLARSFHSKKTFYIGLLIPDVTIPFFTEMTGRIETRLHKQGYKLFLCNAKGRGTDEVQYLNMLFQNKVDGIIIISSFPCGPDSLSNELAIRKVKNIPILKLIFEDFNSDIGIITRLESYFDILKAKKEVQNENN